MRSLTVRKSSQTECERNLAKQEARAFQKATWKTEKQELCKNKSCGLSGSPGLWDGTRGHEDHGANSI